MDRGVLYISLEKHFPAQLAARQAKLCLVIDKKNTHDPLRACETVKKRIKRYRIKVLNIAGPPYSRNPALYEFTRSILDELLS